MAQCYPDRAQRMNTEGTTTLRCQVMANGRLSGCEAVGESPAGFGFGEAATSCLARLFKLAPADQDGTPVAGGTFTFTIRWQLPKDE